MVPVKKLSLILEDTLELLVSMEQRHTGVLVEFTCYRDGQAVHESGPVRRPQLRALLPEACRNARATEVELRCIAVGKQGDSRQLNQSRFLLAAKEPRAQAAPPPTAPGYGLGGFQSPYHPGMDAWGGAGGGGLGAVQETAALVNQIVSDELFRKEHRDLQREAEGLRAKVASLETELAQQQATIDANATVKSYTEQLTPFLPFITQLVAPGSMVAKVAGGLLGVPDDKAAGADDQAAPDDAQTAAVISQVRGFMQTLPVAYKLHLAEIMQQVEKTPALIPRIAASLRPQAQAASKT